MQHESINGMVIRVRDMGDHDRYLSVLTAEKGRILLLSKGSHSMHSDQCSVSQLYCYGNFEYYRRGNFNILKGGSALESFYLLSSDMDRMNLAAYISDLTGELTDEGVEADEMLRLLLNSVYAISRDLYPQPIIKGVFEMRAMAMSGYAPDLAGCVACGRQDGESLYLDVMNGALICSDCLRKRGAKGRGSDYYDEIREAEVLCPVTPAVCAALRYAIAAPIERIFSFELRDPEDLRMFASTAQTYVLSHLGRGFDSLDFYHSMRQEAADR